MALISKDKIDTLLSAEEVAEVAATAELEIELKSIAAAINSAGNTGAKKILYSKDISEAALAQLKEKKYTVVKYTTGACTQYSISWVK